MMDIGRYNADTKKYENHEPLLGPNDDDVKPHTKHILGGDDHDFRPHKRLILGDDDHDFKPHSKYLGGDDHDLKPHSKLLLGGGDHDLKPHSKLLLGGDDHDFKPHKKKLVNNRKFNSHFRNRSQKSLVAVNKIELMNMFKTFLKKFNRTYESAKELKKRFKIFRDNFKKATAMQFSEQGAATYGITKFSDLTGFEFRTLLGLRPHLKLALSTLQPAVIPDVSPPDAFDWRDHGVVTPIKNQGMCGSCWAFSVTGNVEGQWALKHRKLYALSEQELVDCDTTDKGCEGGMPENAYRAIQDLGGLETETGYPYDGRDEKCQLDKSKIKVKVNGSVELPEDEEALRKWLYKNGPISIGINANALQFYLGGVSHPFKFLCSPSDLDHGMLIVGYGVHAYPLFHKNLPFWIVKNSWGKDWGEEGYYRVYRGDGTCGVNKMATSAVVP